MKYLNEIRKDDLNQKMGSLSPGDKCLIKLSNENGVNWVLAYIQTVDNVSATISIPELNNQR